MKPIPNYEGKYLCCPTGRVWTTGSNKLPKGGYLKPWLIGAGYEMVMLYKDKIPKKFLVHRLIATIYIPNPNNLPEVNHKDGNRRNNRPENLEWVTSKQNKAHAWKSGLYNHRGTDHYLAKLDNEKVTRIRKMHEQGYNYPYIAKLIGVSKTTIGLVIRGVIWKHVP